MVRVNEESERTEASKEVVAKDDDVARDTADKANVM